jgi:hypothetical protein
MADDIGKVLASIHGKLDGMPDKFELKMEKRFQKHERELHPRNPRTSRWPSRPIKRELWHGLVVLGAAIGAGAAAVWLV